MAVEVIAMRREASVKISIKNYLKTMTLEAKVLDNLYLMKKSEKV